MRTQQLLLISSVMLSGCAEDSVGGFPPQGIKVPDDAQESSTGEPEASDGNVHDSASGGYDSIGVATSEYFGSDSDDDSSSSGYDSSSSSEGDEDSSSSSEGDEDSSSSSEGDVEVPECLEDEECQIDDADFRGPCSSHNDCANDEACVFFGPPSSFLCALSVVPCPEGYVQEMLPSADPGEAFEGGGSESRVACLLEGYDLNECVDEQCQPPVFPPVPCEDPHKHKGKGKGHHKGKHGNKD